MFDTHAGLHGWTAKRSEAAPTGRAPWMARVNPLGRAIHGKVPAGPFCVWGHPSALVRTSRFDQPTQSAQNVDATRRRRQRAGIRSAANEAGRFCRTGLLAIGVVALAEPAQALFRVRVKKGIVKTRCLDAETLV